MVCKNFNTESSVQAEERGSVVDMIEKKNESLEIKLNEYKNGKV